MRCVVEGADLRPLMPLLEGDRSAADVDDSTAISLVESVVCRPWNDYWVAGHSAGWTTASGARRSQPPLKPSARTTPSPSRPVIEPGGTSSPAPRCQRGAWAAVRPWGVASQPQFPAPNAKYQHLFVVVRLDDPMPMEQPEGGICVVSAFVTEAEANAEADRLNRLNGQKPCRYLVWPTRLKGGAGNTAE